MGRHCSGKKSCFDCRLLEIRKKLGDLHFVITFNSIDFPLKVNLIYIVLLDFFLVYRIRKPNAKFYVSLYIFYVYGYYSIF